MLHLFISETFVLAGLLTAFLMIGCSGSDVEKDNSQENISAIPDSVKSLSNLTIIQESDERIDSVRLIQEFVIEGNGSVPIDGFMWDAAVDSLGRLFVVVRGNQGKSSLFRFDESGNLEQTLDLAGRGPGEFLKVNSIGIRGDSLFLFGSPEKMAVYSSNNLSLIYDEILDKEAAEENDSLSKQMIGKNLHVTSKDLFVRFENINVLSKDRRLFYYPISEDGTVLPEKVLEVRSHPLYLGKAQTFANGKELRPPLEVPFNRHTITRFSKDGSIYSVWSEDVLIKKYDQSGSYEKAFYYPKEKVPLTISELPISDSQRDALNKYELPETWPAVYTMVLDDQQRMWVATVSKSNNYYTWWVIDQEGEIKAKFRLPGNKTKSTPIVEPLIFIKDGHFYIRENSNDIGNQRIVKYRIEGV